jgi:hypothetical protein
VKDTTSNNEYSSGSSSSSSIKTTIESSSRNIEKEEKHRKMPNEQQLETVLYEDILLPFDIVKVAIKQDFNWVVFHAKEPRSRLPL